MAVSDALKPFWGSIQAAATSRLNVAGAFAAMRAASEAQGIALPEGIDAIAMGQAYSAAVRQRNAREALGAAVDNIVTAAPRTADMFRNNAITSDMITPQHPWTQTEVSDVVPTYAVNFQVSIETPEGTSLEYRRVNIGNTLPQTVGQLMDLIDSANELMSEEYGVTQGVTGYGSVLTL